MSKTIEAISKSIMENIIERQDGGYESRPFIVGTSKDTGATVYGKVIVSPARANGWRALSLFENGNILKTDVGHGDATAATTTSQLAKVIEGVNIDVALQTPMREPVTEIMSADEMAAKLLNALDCGLQDEQSRMSPFFNYLVSAVDRSAYLGVRLEEMLVMGKKRYVITVNDKIEHERYAQISISITANDRAAELTKVLTDIRKGMNCVSGASPVEKPSAEGAPLPLYFYANYEYDPNETPEGRTTLPPLAFVTLGDLSPDTLTKLLRQFDSWYGNTFQETTDWALEYQVMSRMLLWDNALVVNPRYLDLEPVIEVLYELLDGISPAAKAVYAQARKLSPDDIMELWKKDN